MTIISRTPRFGAAATGAVAALSVLALALPASAANPPDTLRVGTNSKSPARGNPFAAGFSVPNAYFWVPIFDLMTRVNNKGQTLPMLAESWSVGADKLTWTFVVKKNVVYSNGEPFNAAAVAATFDYLLKDDKGKTTNAATVLRGVKEVTASGDDKVIVKTEKPDPLLAGTLATISIVGPKAWREMGVEAFTQMPVGTGPWKVEKWTDTETNLVENKTSYRPGKIAKMTIMEIPDGVARAQALLSEQIDIATNLGPDDVTRIRAAGHQADVATSPNIQSIALFTEDFSPNKKWGEKGVPFRDKRVRQAMNYAIDRDSIITNLVNGITKPASQPANPATFGYNPDVKPYPYDPAKAKALLTEAGYPNGFKFTSEVLQGFSPNDKEIWTQVADSVGKLGVQMELRPVPFSDWLKKYLGGTWEGESMTLALLVEPHMDAIRPFQNYSCMFAKPFTCIPEHMPLIEAASQEMDPVKREKMLKDLMKVMHDDALSIAIQENVEIAGLNKRVKGFVNWNKILLYENVSFQ